MRAVSRHEWRRLAGMGAFILGLHLVGFGLLVLVIAPEDFAVGGQTFGIGLGITAYTLGMRHAFDADHIAAIDVTTRKMLVDGGKRPLSVGFWFSLGHSSVVFGLCFLLAMGIRSLAGGVKDENSTLHDVTGTLGLSVSTVFLLLLGVLNLLILVGIVRVFRAMRSGKHDDAELEDMLNNRGLLNRIFGRTLAGVKKPWQMYPVGLLFGLGFDTATEIALLVLASSSAALALPWYAILCLPILFTAGMCLFDTMDGAFMNFAYGWALAQPVRKVYYNLTVTALSVIVALGIGGLQALTLAAEKLHLEGGIWAAVTAVGDFEYTGYLLVGLFVSTWAVSWAIWRFGKIEQRFAPVVRS